MKKRNLIYGSLITALGLFTFIYSGRYASTMTLGQGSTGGEFFPRLISLGLIITGCIVAVTALLSKKPDEDADPIKWISLLINMSIFAVFYLLLKPLGFIVDCALISGYLMYQMGCRKYWVIALWSILMSSLIFCLFYYGLYVGLPLGILKPILPKY